MFEDNQQWDDNEYSDDTEYEYSDDDEFEDDEDYEEEVNEEYSDDDEEYEDSDEEDDDEEYSDDDEEYDEDGEESDDEEFEDYDDEGGKKNNNAVVIIIAIILLLLLLLGGAFLFMQGKNNSVSQTSNMNGEQQSADNSGYFAPEGGSADGGETTEISFDDNGNVSIAEENGDSGKVITVSDVPEGNLPGNPASTTENEEFVNKALNDVTNDNDKNSQDNDTIMVAYTKAANQNPFKPPVRNMTAATKDGDYIPYAVVKNDKYEIFEPPVKVEQDENLIRLLNTEISGIMYDSTSPSAIIKLNNTDYYVKQGDKISGYTVSKITKDSVQINYKNNTYVATVGELFSRDAVNTHDVANVESKFGGRYKYGN